LFALGEKVSRKIFFCKSELKKPAASQNESEKPSGDKGEILVTGIQWAQK
jgi:hypothetical protein